MAEVFAENRNAEEVLRPNLRDLAALVVDDHPVHLRILFELLASWGLRPAMAPSGAEALAELQRKADAGDAYSLVVLDHRMPDMSGIEVAERIRSAPELAGAILLLLSSGDPPMSAERCKELGITVCLTKPLKESELLEGLLAAVEAAGPRHAAVTAPAALGTSAKPLRILVAEDNAINQRLVQAILAERGHSIVMTANGREALAALDREAFDVVLMDVQMPEMNGFQATAAIRAREGSTGARIPIIALTAHAFKEDRERCLAAGMDAYLAKPLRFDELVELVENAPSVRGSPAPPSARHGDGVSKELTALFVEDAARIGGEIRDAVARGDGPALQGAAHRLRGTAGYFGADRTLELTARLEQFGRAADFTAETMRLSQMLSDEIARLERELSGSQSLE
ncbi:MAG TPA: response regulator [Thermoanaerobaculia bacterium]|nr:response regulator [Thermoanaerobaculia bacterium]